MSGTAEFLMDPKGIGDCLSHIEQALSEYRMRRRDLMEALLLSEETLLLLKEHAPESARLQVSVTKKMGVPRIRFQAPGTPLALDEHIGTVSAEYLSEETENVIRGIMLRSYADSIRYRHSRAGNCVTLITGIPERILAARTVMAFGLAVAAGFLLRGILPAGATQWLLHNVLAPVETLFISGLMCITAPAVFASITCSMFRFEGFSELGRTGKTVIVSYLLTSILAILMGVCSFMVFMPGETGLLSGRIDAGAAEGFSLLTILTTLIPPNIIEPFVSVNSIQLMLTALVIGTALTMCGKRVCHLRTLLEEMDTLFGKVSSLIMQVVPIVVFCATANGILNANTGTFLPTLQLLVTLLAALAGMLVIYCLILLFAARLNPITFLRKYAPTMKNTFLKGSGVASIPMTMRVCRRQLGIPQSICSFSIPLGATINMDGNCVCLTVISLFFVRLCGVSLDTNDTVIMLLLVLILSLGAPIAPGTLILCLVTLLTQMGIDTGVISLVIGINFILEMLLGMINSVGDVVVALVAARRENTLDLARYKKR